MRCIVENGKPKRVSDEQAASAVKAGTAHYISKQAYKAAIKPKKAKKKEPEIANTGDKNDSPSNTD